MSDLRTGERTLAIPGSLFSVAVIDVTFSVCLRVLPFPADEINCLVGREKLSLTIHIFCLINSPAGPCFPLLHLSAVCASTTPTPASWKGRQQVSYWLSPKSQTGQTSLSQPFIRWTRMLTRTQEALQEATGGKGSWLHWLASSICALWVGFYTWSPRGCRRPPPTASVPKAFPCTPSTDQATTYCLAYVCFLHFK